MQGLSHRPQRGGPRAQATRVAPPEELASPPPLRTLLYLVAAVASLLGVAAAGWGLAVGFGAGLTLSRTDSLVALLEARDRLRDLCDDAKQRRGGGALVELREVQVLLPRLLPQVERIRQALPTLQGDQIPLGARHMKPCLTHEGNQGAKFGHHLGLAGMERARDEEDQDAPGWGTPVQCASRQLRALDRWAQRAAADRDRAAERPSWRQLEDRVCHAHESLVAVLHAESDLSRGRAEFTKRFNELTALD